MEANKYSWRTTAHSCDHPNANGYYANCDKTGEGQDKDSWGEGAYGPGSSKIDTNKKFNVNIKYCNTKGNFEGYAMHLKQGLFANERLGDFNEGYMMDLTNDVDGNLAYVFSNWGSQDDDLSWLNHGKCSGECSD